MPRHVVCLTFDFDAMTGFIARGMTTPTPISRGEFGLIGLVRILQLLDAHAIRATFFVPGVVIDMFADACERIVAAGHEIGHHGYTHVPPANLSREQEADGLAKGNASIARITGEPARGYRSPSWDLSAHTIDLLLEHAFVYESSMMGNDHMPYRVRHGDVIELEKPAVFGKETRLIEMPVSWTLDDYPHFEFLRTKATILQGLMNANSVLENWINDFLYMKKTEKWGILNYTFHPFVIGRGHRMMALEKLLKRLSNEGARFMAMEDAARAYDKKFPFKG